MLDNIKTYPMELKHHAVESKGIKITMNEENREVGRAFLYILKNNLHKEPFGLMEDVFVIEEMRNKGIGAQLVKAIIMEAKKQGCYKLIATSRFANDKAVKLYEKIGFKEHGTEFRINFN